MAFEANIQIAVMEGIHANDFRVFHLLLPTIERGNEVYVSVVGMAKQLRTTVPVVSRSLRKLVERGIIERAAGDRRVYRLNPWFGWYGADAGAHTQAIKEWDQGHASVQ